MLCYYKMFDHEPDVFVTSENGSWIRRRCWSHFVSKRSLNGRLVNVWLNVSMATRQAEHKQVVTQTDSSNFSEFWLMFAQRNEGSRQRPTGNTRSSSDRRHQWSSEFLRILTFFMIFDYFGRFFSSNLRIKVGDETGNQRDRTKGQNSAYKLKHWALKLKQLITTSHRSLCCSSGRKRWRGSEYLGPGKKLTWIKICVSESSPQLQVTLTRCCENSPTSLPVDVTSCQCHFLSVSLPVSVTSCQCHFLWAHESVRRYHHHILTDRTVQQIFNNLL